MFLKMLNPIPMWKQGRRINFLIAALTITFFSCHSNIKKKERVPFNFNWLCSNWINDADTSALFFENWSQFDSTEYHGTSFIIAHHDTVFYESISLLNTDTGIYYQVSVRNQNDAQKVSFKLVSDKNNRVIFENKNHDFPQIIGYNYASKDTLNAWIEGMVKGKYRKENFMMWRK